MATGNAWTESPTGKPKAGYPWALWDPNAKTDVPFDVAAWMAKLGSTYASHVILTDENLECIQNNFSDPVIVARIGAKAGGALVKGKKYGFTFRVTTANGQVDDRTLWFKVQEL